MKITKETEKQLLVLCGCLPVQVDIQIAFRQWIKNNFN
jgi:homoserine trans-succinylase